MAKRTVIVLTDDLTGGKADKEVNFSIDGEHIEIDLSDHNYSLLRNTLQPFIDAGRKVSPKGKAGQIRPRTGDVPSHDLTGRKITAVPRAQREAYIERQAIRQWAASKGIDVAERGVIAAEVVARYHREAGSIPVQARPTPPPPEEDPRPRTYVVGAPNPFEVA